MNKTQPYCSTDLYFGGLKSNAGYNYFMTFLTARYFQGLKTLCIVVTFLCFLDSGNHGLRTPSESINQRNLKIWADGAGLLSIGQTQYQNFGIVMRILLDLSLLYFLFQPLHFI